MNVNRLEPGQCPVCGALDSVVSFSGESLTARVGYAVVIVDELSGERCKKCGEILFDDDSARRYAAAGDALVLKSRE